jgi:hypothetical protein
MSEPPKHQRICKQCAALMETPLELDGKLWMFCSASCKALWDRSAKYIKALNQ